MAILTRFEGRRATPSQATAYTQGKVDPQTAASVYAKKDPALEGAPFEIKENAAKMDEQNAVRTNESIQKTVAYLEEMQRPDELFLAKAKADMQLFSYDAYNEAERRAQPGGNLRGEVAGQFDQMIQKQAESAPNDQTKTQLLLLAPSLRAKLEIQADESQKNLNDVAAVRGFASTTAQYDKLAKKYPQYAEQLKQQIDQYASGLSKASGQKDTINSVAEINKKFVDDSAISARMMEGGISKEEFDSMSADNKHMATRKLQALEKTSREIKQKESEAMYSAITKGYKLSSYDFGVLKDKAKKGDASAQRAVVAYQASRRMDSMSLQEIEELEKQLEESQQKRGMNDE